MKLTGHRVERFAWRPGAAARNARGSWPAREGLKLTLTDERGGNGLGEASPLPGWSPDDLESSVRALEALGVREGVTLDEARPLVAILEVLESLPRSQPAARFAVETALLQLFAARARTTSAALLGATDRTPRALAALVSTPDPQVAAAQVRAAVQAGAACVKIKVDCALDPEPWIAAGAGPQLRWDANRSARDPARLQSWLQAAAASGAQWLEEPAPIDLVLSLPSLDAPIALDETLVEPGGRGAMRALAARGALAAVVLKPALLGGVLAALDLAAEARALGVPAVISHLFDGSIAWRAYVAAAFALPPGPAHGLGAHPGLDEATAAVATGYRVTFPEVAS